MTMNNGNKKKRKIFTYEEDQKLIQLVKENGTKNWELISSMVKTRTPRQCRERWKFYLCPTVNRSPWTPEEDRILFLKYKEYGSKWSILCKFLKDRTLDNVRNRWNSVIRKVRSLRLNENSEEDFFYCARLITKFSANTQQKKDNERQVIPESNSKYGPPFEPIDPLAFLEINNLLNHIPEPV